MPHTLLLADDSVTIQRVIELTFADEDIKVVAVSDGDQAIARLQAAAPDIVLADIGMPGKNGYEVAQYVRQTPTLSHIPVVLLTGAFEPVDQARAAEAGCDGVLAKPFEPQQVIGRVRELLAKGHHSSSPAVADTVIAPPAGGDGGAMRDAQLDEYLDQLDRGFPSEDTKAVAAVPDVSMPAAAEAAPLAPAEIDWFNSTPAPSAESAGTWDLGAAAPVEDTKAADTSGEFAEFEAAMPAPAPAPIAIEIDHHPAATASAPPAIEAPAPEPVAAPAPITIAPSVEPPPVVPSTPSFVSSRLSEEPAVVSLTGDASRLPSLGDAFATLLAAEQDAPAAAEWPGTGSAAAAAQAIKDSMLDDIVQRVLARMSDAVVRNVTTTLVSEIAERLVREEIERIKAAAK